VAILRDARKRAPQDEARYHRGKPPRPIAHIGFLFSDLVVAGQLSLFGASPDSKFCTEFDLDPATRRCRQAGQRPIAFT
jgi:hypothetical protein